MLHDRVVEQRLEQNSALGIGDAPADDAAAEDVEDDIEIEVAPLGWPHQLGDVPGPDLVWMFRQQLGFLVDRVAELLAAFANLVVLAEDAIHGADRAVVDTFIEQAGVNLGRRLVGEAWRMQQIQHPLLLRNGQRAGGFWPRARDRRRRGQTGAPALHAGARDPERGTGRFGHAAGWCECHDGVRQGSLSLRASGMPSSAATFFGCR